MPDLDWERQQAAWKMRQALSDLDQAIDHLHKAEEIALTMVLDHVATDIAVYAALLEGRALTS